MHDSQMVAHLMMSWHVHVDETANVRCQCLIGNHSLRSDYVGCALQGWVEGMERCTSSMELPNPRFAACPRLPVFRIQSCGLLNYKCVTCWVQRYADCLQAPSEPVDASRRQCIPSITMDRAPEVPQSIPKERFPATAAG